MVPGHRLRRLFPHCEREYDRRSRMNWTSSKFFPGGLHAQYIARCRQHFSSGPVVVTAARCPGRRRSATRQGPLRRPRATRWRSAGSTAAMRYQHSFWYCGQRRNSSRKRAKADPECGIALLGRRADAARQSAYRAIPAPNLAPGLAAIQKAKAMGAKTERERDFIDALTLDVRRLRQAAPSAAHARLSRRHGEAGDQISERRRSADLLRHHAQHLAPRRPTRPMRSSSRARRSSSRSSSACRSTRASRTT